MVLSCLDSLVSVEDVFDQGIGDVFLGRVAGNFVNTDLSGSMEFACKVAGAKLIIVMGHQHCGAV
jgi:carbonic anhydrase